MNDMKELVEERCESPNLEINLIATPYNVGKSSALKFLNSNATIFKENDRNYIVRLIYDYGFDEEARRLIRKQSRRMQFFFGMILCVADTLNDFSRAIDFSDSRITFEIMTHLDFKMVNEHASLLTLSMCSEPYSNVSKVVDVCKNISEHNQYAWIPEWGDPAKYTNAQVVACLNKNLTLQDCSDHYAKINGFKRLELPVKAGIIEWMRFDDYK